MAHRVFLSLEEYFLFHGEDVVGIHIRREEGQIFWFTVSRSG